MFRHIWNAGRVLAGAAAVIVLFVLPDSPAFTPTAGAGVAVSVRTPAPGDSSVLDPVALASDASGGWKFPLGLRACALSVGTAIAGLAFVPVAPLGALNAFTAGFLSMLYTCS